MNKRRPYILASIAIIVLFGAFLLWRYPCLLTGSQDISTIVDYPGNVSLEEMTQSTEVVIVGRVEAIQSRSWYEYNLTQVTEFPTTIFNVTVLQTVKPSAFNQSRILVSQSGYDYDCRKFEESGDPLMRVGKEYVFFLDRWRNADGSFGSDYVRIMGPFSMFLVRDGRVYPRMESWSPSVSGVSVESLVQELDKYLS
jgi:hypothetical protein